MEKEKIVRLIWQCNNCKDVVVSYSNIRHQMDECDCGKSYVDLEQYYQRNGGSVKIISKKVLEKGEWKNI